jgi:hypothetical protein
MPLTLRVQKKRFRKKKAALCCLINISHVAFPLFASKLAPIIPARAPPRKALGLFLALFTNNGAFFLAQKQKARRFFCVATRFLWKPV